MTCGEVRAHNTTDKKYDVVGRFQIDVNPKELARVIYTVGAGASNVNTQSFNAIPTPTPTSSAAASALATPSPTFRNLLSEKSTQRNGGSLTAQIRLTESKYVNLFATVGLFGGTGGGQLAGLSLGYLDQAFLTVAGHFTTSSALNPAYTLEQNIPAGISSVPTVNRQVTGLYVGIHVSRDAIKDLVDQILGKSSATSK